MSKLYTMVGLPGSGKSTWAGARSDCMVVSTDAIRKELFGDESEQKNGALVFEIAYARLAQAVALGHDVIFDATNVKRKSRAELFKRFPDVEHVAVFVNTPFLVCKERNNQRERRVPVSVIRRMSYQLEPPTREEGFSQIIEVKEKG